MPVRFVSWGYKDATGIQGAWLPWEAVWSLAPSPSVDIRLCFSVLNWDQGLASLASISVSSHSVSADVCAGCKSLLSVSEVSCGLWLSSTSCPSHITSSCFVSSIWSLAMLNVVWNGRMIFFCFCCCFSKQDFIIIGTLNFQICPTLFQ